MWDRHKTISIYKLIATHCGIAIAPPPPHWSKMEAPYNNTMCVQNCKNDQQFYKCNEECNFAVVMTCTCTPMPVYCTLSVCLWVFFLQNLLWMCFVNVDPTWYAWLLGQDLACDPQCDEMFRWWNKMSKLKKSYSINKDTVSVVLGLLNFTHDSYP